MWTRRVCGSVYEVDVDVDVEFDIDVDVVEDAYLDVDNNAIFVHYGYSDFHPRRLDNVIAMLPI
jgi:hypothetical protein